QQSKNTRKINSIFKQTARLTEFKTEVNDKLDDIKGDINYLTAKEAANEREIYKIQRKLQMINEKF
ncbi:MAG: hypothetical protein ACOCRB_01615, partial [Halanaerobiaceae bacterium]